MNELDPIDAWLAAQLAATVASYPAPTQRLCSDPPAPATTPYPFVQWQYLGGPGDTNCLGDQRCLVTADYLVEAVVDEDHYAALAPVADAIDAALHAQHAQVQGPVLIDCLRQRLSRRRTVEGGQSFYFRGGVYRIWAAPS